MRKYQLWGIHVFGLHKLAQHACLPPACILLPPAGCRCRCLRCSLPALLSTCAVHNCSTLLAVFPGLQRRFVTRSSSFNKEQFEELLAHSGILNGGQCCPCYACCD